jgi:hypothetical protein
MLSVKLQISLPPSTKTARDTAFALTGELDAWWECRESSAPYEAAVLETVGASRRWVWLSGSALLLDAPVALSSVRAG